LREIKFRAWDKSEEKIIYSDKEYYDYDFRCDEHGNLLCYSNCSYADTFGDEHDEWVKLDSVMQYTGLKDKNGKEIYEGDIIKHQIKDTRTVVFKDGAFQTKRLVPVKGELHDTFFFYECTGKDWEVIGNIYENPSLLEEN